MELSCVVSSSTFLILAGVLYLREYQRLVWGGQVVQWMLSTLMALPPVSPHVRTLDRGMATFNIMCLSCAHHARGVSWASMAWRLCVPICCFCGYLFQRRNVDDVTPWYLLWHTFLFVFNVELALTSAYTIAWQE